MARVGTVFSDPFCSGEVSGVSNVFKGKDFAGYVSGKRYCGAFYIDQLQLFFAAGQPRPPPTPSQVHLQGSVQQDHHLIDVKQKLTEAQERVDELQRKLRNARDRERRHTKTVKSLLQDLKEKNLLTEELQHKLDSYSDLPVELFKKDCVFTQAQREFSLTLHLHGPKAYKYLRETMKIPLPHPHTLQRWLQTVDAKPGLNTSLLDMLQQQKNDDPARFGEVCLMVYDSHTQKMTGFVNLGDGMDETSVASD
ncbi:uncharacterized protein LOC126396951 [Epinephelus moara]|uniref:uncharacterized protein LOC126396951 n=1 Tax=Epinephelus moara TaxID=300413 RepID=UPI00214E8469|nr:uncharacterized protein LOC126396951 [Epinephelus moara]